MERNGIKYIEGDLFTHIHAQMVVGERFISIPHVCNNIGKMGSGFVVPLYQQWPEVKLRYEDWFRGEGEYQDQDRYAMDLGRVQTVSCSVSDGAVYVANMIAQNETIGTDPKPIRYAALCDCMAEVANGLIDHQNAEIHCPMFGCDRARGTWEFIEELIAEIWLSKDLPVYVYVLDKTRYRALSMHDQPMTL